MRPDIAHGPRTAGFLRIAIFFDSIPPHGGMCSFEHIGPALSEMGHGVRVYVRNRIPGRESNQYVLRFVENGIRVISGSGVRSRLSDLRLFLVLVSTRLIWRPHLAIVARADSAALLDWTRFLGLPSIYVEATHPSPTLSGEWWYRDLQKYLKRTQVVVAPSSRSRDALREYHHVSAPIKIVPFAIRDLPCPAANSSNSGPVRVGTTCRLDKNKGLDYLVTAARHLADAGVDVVFVLWGSGDHQTSLERKVSRLGLEHLFTFAGEFDSRRDLDHVMAGIDVYVLPSLLEGMPISVMEAMAYGRPVVATDCGGIIDLVRHGESGFVVPKRDSRALARAISDLVESPELRRAMGRRGRRIIASSYTANRAAKSWIEQCRDTLDRSKRGKALPGACLAAAEALGRLYGLMPSYRNPGGVFFFFKWAKLGGAEAVHGEIARLASSRSPWVCISEPVTEQEDLHEYPAEARVFLGLRSDGGTLRQAFSLGVFSSAVNRCANPLVLGGHSGYFYQLIKRLGPHVTRVDMVHGYGADLVDSTSSAPGLDLRMLVCDAMRGHLESVYLENNVDTRLLARTAVLGAATDIPPPERVSRKRPPFSVIFVGRGCPEKGIHVAGMISSRLFLEHNVKVTMIGDVENWVHEQDRPQCNFAGYIQDREKLRAVLASAHVIIITSFEEGVPLVLMEAMAHRVVPVATDAGGISEHIINGRNGFLVRKRSEREIVDAFAANLESLIKDPALTSRMADHAYSWALEKFCPERFKNSLSGLFDAPQEFVAGITARDPPERRGISVLIYLFDDEGLEPTLESVLTQSFEDLEIRILDDCSQRESSVLRSLLEDPRIHYAKQRMHFGFTSTMNRLLTWSRGEVVVPFACGDRLEEGALQKIWEAHVEDPHAALIQFPVTLTDENYQALSGPLRSVIEWVSKDALLDVGPALQTLKSAMIEPSRLPDGIAESGYWKDLELRSAETCLVKWHDRAVSQHPVGPGTVLDSSEAMMEASIPVAYAYRDAGRRRRNAGGRAWSDNTAFRMFTEGVEARWKLGGHDGASSLVLLACLRVSGLPLLSLKLVERLRGLLSGKPREVQTGYLPRMYKMRDPFIQQNTGELIDDAVCCYRGQHEPAHCVFGPGFPVRSNGALMLVVYLEFRDLVEPGAPLANIDVYDSSDDYVLTGKMAFPGNRDSGSVEIDVPFEARRGQKLEFRVWWYGNSDLRVTRLYLGPATADVLLRRVGGPAGPLV